MKIAMMGSGGVGGYFGAKLAHGGADVHFIARGRHLEAMRTAHAMTIDYARQRKQFGVPISSFQVLQHRMVDMFMHVEQSVSMTYMATLKLDESDDERKKAASAAKVQIGKACKFVGQSAIQIHGGMGMTDELAVGHYFKRCTMIEGLFGSVDHHLRRYETLSLGEAA